MSDATTPTVPDGIDAAAVTDWLTVRTDITPPLTFSTVHGGRSNLTYIVTDEAGRTLVLRRPPLHSVLKSAHDVAREHRLMAALQDSAVPVPPLVGLEEDDAVNDAPFYVMEFVGGHVIRDRTAAETLLDDAARRTASESLVDTLAALHEIDPDDVGLGDLAKKQDYIARQLKRWQGQYEKGKIRDLPQVTEVHDRLAADIPPQGRAAIVHGDYRLDNVIVSSDGEVQAVLDWELCTLGDRRADVAMLDVYWGGPEDQVQALGDPPTTAPGFLTRDEAVRRYAATSGLDMSEHLYFRAFALWKLAVILEGVFARFSGGAYGDDIDDSHRAFADTVEQLLRAAETATTEAGR